MKTLQTSLNFDHQNKNPNLAVALRAEKGFIEFGKRFALFANSVVQENRRLRALLVLFEQSLLPLLDAERASETNAALFAFSLLSEDIEFPSRPNVLERVRFWRLRYFHGFRLWSWRLRLLLLLLVLLVVHCSCGFRNLNHWTERERERTQNHRV